MISPQGNSMGWYPPSWGESSINKNMYFFAQGQISCTGRRKNLHHGTVVFHMWVSSLLVQIYLGVSKWESKMVHFAQFIFGESSSLCVVNVTTEAWQTPPRFSGLMYRVDRRRLRCVLKAAVDIVHRASTVITDVDKLRRSSRWWWSSANRPDIPWKSRVFHTHLHSTPPLI